MKSEGIDGHIQIFSALPDSEARRAWLTQKRGDATIDFIELAQTLKTNATALMRDGSDQAQHLVMLLADMAEHLHDPQIQALADWTWGNAHIFQGHHADCLARYQSALQFYISVDDQKNIAALRSNCASIHTNLGNYEQAIAEFEAVQALLDDTEPTSIAMNLALNLAWNYQQLDRFTEAATAAKEGRAIALELNLPNDVARLDINLALALEGLGQFEEAIRLLIAAEATLAANEALLDRARARFNLGLMRFRLGEYQQALQDMEQARRWFDSLNNPMQVATVDGYQAQIYLQLNLLTETIDLCQNSRAIQLAHGLKRDGAIADYNSGIAYARLGESLLAQQYLAEAGQALDDLNLPIQKALVDLARSAQTINLILPVGSTAHMSTAHTEQADAPSIEALQAAEGLAQRAVALFQSYQLDLYQAEALAVLGHVQRQMARYDTLSETSSERYSVYARQSYETGLALLAEQSHHVLFGDIFYGLGQLAQAEDDFDQALDWYEQAMQKIETTLLALEDSELRAGFLYDKLGLFQAAIDLHLQMGHHDHVLRLMELARPVPWQAAPISSTGEGAGAELEVEIAQLRQQWQWHYRKLYGDKLTTMGDESQEQDEVVRGQATQRIAYQRQKALRQCEEALTRSIRNLRLHYHRDQTGLDVTEVTVANVRAQLAPQQCLLLFYTANEQCTIFIITHEEMYCEFLPTRWSDIRQRISEMHFELNWGDEQAKEHLHWLWQALLGPVTSRFTQCTELIIIPHSQLYHLPFHALYDGQHYLLDHFQIQYAPTLSWFIQARHRAPDRAGCERPLALIMACSSEESLPGTIDEAQAIYDDWLLTTQDSNQTRFVAGTWGHLDVQLCLEERATADNLRQQAAYCRLLHIAAHGEFRRDNPLFSALHLGDGPLLLADLDRLHFQAAPLVILSACETGKGESDGANILGISQAFLRAGAGILLVTLWRIPDIATTQLMRHFYQQLMAGTTPSQALRQAQLYLLEKPEFAHPLYWAGWVLLGRNED